MTQNTLDAFLVSIPRSSGAEPQERDQTTKTQPEKASVACQFAERATSHHLIRTLTCFETGLLSRAKRARTELQHLNWAKYKQVAGYTTRNGDIEGVDDTISSIAIHPTTGSMAFLQAHGVLNLYPMQSLIDDANAIRSRVTKAQSAQQKNQPQVLLPQNNTGSSAPRPSGTTRRSVGTRTSSHHLADLRRDQLAQQLADDRQLAMLCVDNLPSGGMRLNLGSRVEEVQWCANSKGKMAVVGGSAPLVTMLEFSEGRRHKWDLTVRPDGSSSSARFTNIVTMNQGPYTLGAASSQGPCVWLWDERQSRVASTQLFTPSRAPLTGSMQASPDGHLMYAVTQGNQLLVWDLRKGSNTSGVLHFGGTGFYQHPLLLQQPLSAALTAAMRQQLAPLTKQQQQGQQGQGDSGAMDPEQAAFWQVLTEPAHALSPPPVDQVLLDPTNPNRVALIMQDCSAAVLQLPSSSITHMCLAPNNYANMDERVTTLALAGPRYHMRRKKGCWAAGGDMLLLPHVYKVVSPTPQAFDDAWIQEAVMLGLGEGLYMPAVAVMDCRHGWHADEPWAPVCESRQAAGQGRTLDTLCTTRAGDLAGRWLSRHVVASCDQDLVVPPSRAGGLWPVGQVLQWQHKPMHMMPACSWVTCVARQEQPFGWLAAGTQDGHLLLMGP